MARTYTFAEMADTLGISAKKARALHRKNVRANGGVIGKDTPGKGKRYALDARAFAAIKADVERALSASEASDAADEAPDA